MHVLTLLPKPTAYVTIRRIAKCVIMGHICHMPSNK